MAFVYGYVFAREEREAMRQKEVLKGLSVPPENIFIDEIPENGRNRPRLQKLEKRLQKNDLVYIKSLSWLGNNYDEILEEWQNLTEKQRADIVVLDKPLLDTRRGKEIMSSFVSDIVIETLKFVAENEHDKYSSRQTESYLAAKARGVRYGRPRMPLPKNFDSVYQQWKAGNITGVRAAEECEMPLSSFRYRAKLYGNEDNHKQHK